MYVPSPFSVPEPEVAAALRSMAAADLITTGPGGLVATLLPWLFEQSSAGDRLVGHVARNNSHWTLAGGEVDSLVIMRGSDGYVSPSWYQSKAEHGRVVPTWNYETIHVYGRLIAHDDVEWLRDVVTRLTDRFEAGRTAPWQVADAPGAFIDGQLRAIVGLELRITRVEAKAKLSQNRPEADRAGVLAALESEQPDSGLTAAMRASRSAD